MKILITGICGFVGSTLAKALRNYSSDYEVFGIDNLSRSGSWLNREPLMAMGIHVVHGDIRIDSDLNVLPAVDWVIDAAANPSVLAGIDNKTSSLQLVQNNLHGTINLLEYCKKNNAGFILLSTSRVYNIPGISSISVIEENGAFVPSPDQNFSVGISAQGISERYSTTPPVSLYGSTKVASEHLALEYGATFNFPVWINRCGVMAGAGQFGHPGQGIFAYWIHSYKEKQPLKYIGFGGNGYQVRDCLHPSDLVDLLNKQFSETIKTNKPRTINLSGGSKNVMSLWQLSQWCNARFGEKAIERTNAHRAFDIPWMVLDSSLANQTWGWQAKMSLHQVLNEIADFAETQTSWCQLSAL